MRQYLDCGCCVNDDGTRTVCPTCADGRSVAPECPCNGEGYAGIAADMERMRAALRYIMDEASAPAGSLAVAQKRLQLCLLFATGGLEE